jgi:serine O-acetyltransferase
VNSFVVALYRTAHALRVARFPRLAKLVVLAIRLLFGCYLGAGARIGRRVSLAYGGMGIVIHDKAVIGDDVRIGAHVVIGGRSKLADVPVIGDRVVISAGAKLLGPIHIGDEAVIGANAVVIADVEPRTVVGGVPARVLKREIDIAAYHDGLGQPPEPALPRRVPRESGRKLQGR